MPSTFQRVVMNLVPANKRYETLDGRRHLVVPTVMIKEGVWNGTQGPLYYSAERLSKNPESWNHRPAVIYHPTLDNGEGISACDPNVIRERGVGMLFNTVGGDGRLKTETWFDEAKLKTVNLTVYKNLQNNQPVEVSTGMIADVELSPGEWEGKPYVGVVTSISPDHLAILPDQKGACSIQDGAGLLMNAELSYDDLRTQIRQQLVEMHQKDTEGNDSDMEYGPYSYCYVCDIFQTFVVYEMDGNLYSVDYKIRDGKVSMTGVPDSVYRQVTYITTNGESVRCKSLDQIRFSLAKQRPDFGQIVNVEGTHVTCASRDGVFRLPYSIEEGMIRFVGEPELEPEMSTTVKRVNNTPTVLDPPRKDHIDKLIGAKLFTETDRSWLEGLTPEDFARVNKQPKPAEPPTTPILTVPEGVQALEQAAGIQNQQQEVTVEQYLNNNSLPPAVKSFLQKGLDDMRAEKEQLVSVITSNKSNRFTKEWLMAIDDINQLRGMAALCGQTQQTHNRSGQPSMFVDNGPYTPPTAGEGRVLEAPKPVFNKNGSHESK